MSTTKRFDTPNLSIKLNKTHRPKIQKEKKKKKKNLQYRHPQVNREIIQYSA